MNLARSRDFLLRAPLVYRVNAYLKARATRRGLARLAARYSAAARETGVSVSEEETVGAVRERLRRRGAPRAVHQPLRIFWVGANLPQDDSGFLQALRTFGQVRTFENCEGDYGLLFRGRNGRFRVRDPDVIERNDRALLEQVETAFQDEGVDLLMGQMWANFVSASVLRRIQAMGIPTVNVSMDDRLPIHWGTRQGVRLGSIGLKDGLDLVLTTSPECCLWYAVEGCPALFWPLASDPRRFAPAPEARKRYDVTFVGNRYGLRGRIVDTLIASGIHVETFGAGWANGAIGAEQSTRVFAESKIILGVGTIGHATDLYTLKLRDFDAPMAGALYVTHRNPDLLRLYEEDREIVCYESIDECVRKIRFYLAEPEKRLAIASAGAAKARACHTWSQRLSYVMRVLDLPHDRRAD